MRSGAELTVRSLVLGALLSALLSAANAYLGLFAGMTVSASVPAAVLSMALLRGLRGTILENNLVQTAASAGEAAAAGAIFTLPALVMLGAWPDFDYVTTTLLVGSGGVLGVMMTIPLKQALIVHGALPFPEGVATAEVLRAGHAKPGDQSSVRGLALGATFGAFAKLLEAGFAVSRSSVEGALLLRGAPLYLGVGLSPALGAVGFIVGLPVAALMLAGGLLNWLVVIPLVTEAEIGQSALDAAWTAWSTRTRYLGVGAMTVGGLWTLISLRHALLEALRAGARALGGGSAHGASASEDLAPKVLLTGIGAALLTVIWLLFRLTGSVTQTAVLSVMVLTLGFLFSAVAAYMAGLVGSSNNPVSGVTIATILVTATALLLFGAASSHGGRFGPAAALIVGSVICTAAAIGGDNMQDLKTGHLLGASPRAQQIAQLVGVLAAALVIAPVLNLLLVAYGFGPASALHPQALRAPQATLMASVAAGVFGGGLPWAFVVWGGAFSVAVIGVDLWLLHRGARFRTPVLAVGIGIYLPLELSMPVFLGGLVAHHVKARSMGSGGPPGNEGLLMAAGLITGEALLGIVLALVVALAGSLKVLTLGEGLHSGVAGLMVLATALWLLGRRSQAALLPKRRR